MNDYVQKTSEASLQDWAREHFGLTYGQLCALVALVVGYRIGPPDIIGIELDALVCDEEGRGGAGHLHDLERLGFCERTRKGGSTGHQQMWTPTPRALRLLPALPLWPTVAKSGPVNAAPIAEAC